MTSESKNIEFDPDACLKALSAAFHELETVLSVLPTNDRQVVYDAKINIGELMKGVLDFILDDDRAA